MNLVIVRGGVKSNWTRSVMIPTIRMSRVLNHHSQPIYITLMTPKRRVIVSSGLRINNKKSKFCTSEIRYLGFVVIESGLELDKDQITIILKHPTPRNLKELRRYLGMTSWYRKFIPDYATAAAPLTLLLRKNQKWIWQEAQQRALSEIRVRLTESPILSCPDFEVPFELQTDDINTGLGAVLTQTIHNAEHVIAYASRSLSAAERN